MEMNETSEEMQNRINALMDKINYLSEQLESVKDTKDLYVEDLLKVISDKEEMTKELTRMKDELSKSKLLNNIFMMWLHGECSSVYAKSAAASILNLKL